MRGKEQAPDRAELKLSSDRLGGAAVAVAIVIILIVVGAAGYFVVFTGNHATVDITVQSTHIIADTDVTVFVDGKNVGTYKVSNLNNAHITYEYKWSILDDSKIIEVSAISTGGLLGVQTDSRTITVQNGETERVTLLV
ncbi:MAG: hypothetical protein LBT41_01980 [Candidatus Methanoplasma sp.]|nr:hypothetical protein [Candidatus Methanoplasma sp.]